MIGRLQRPSGSHPVCRREARVSLGNKRQIATTYSHEKNQWNHSQAKAASISPSLAPITSLHVCEAGTRDILVHLFELCAIYFVIYIISPHFDLVPSPSSSSSPPASSLPDASTLPKLTTSYNVSKQSPPPAFDLLFLAQTKQTNQARTN